MSKNETIEPSKDDIPGDEKTTALVNWDEKLAQFAAEAAAEETIQGTWMSVKAGRLTIDKTPVAGNVLDCVIVAFARENAYYVGKFDPQNPKPPVCYAIQPVAGDHSNEDDMQPHSAVSDPQNGDCFSCPKNQWKSGEGGKGKACKNIRRLALLPLDAAKDPEKAATADEIYLKLPVMSVRNWGKYVNDVAVEHRRPPFAVVTQISTEPDAQSQFKVTFKFGFKITDPAVLDALYKRHQRMLETIDFPYPDQQAPAPEQENAKY